MVPLSAVALVFIFFRTLCSASSSPYVFHNLPDQGLTLVQRKAVRLQTQAHWHSNSSYQDGNASHKLRKVHGRHHGPPAGGCSDPANCLRTSELHDHGAHTQSEGSSSSNSRSMTFLLRHISMPRKLSAIIIGLGVLAMVTTRGLEQLFQNGLSKTVFVIDVLVWYFATAVYLATSQEIARTTSSNIDIGIICFMQVFAGSALLPLAEVKALGNMSLHAALIATVVACAFYYGSYFALDGLARGGVLVVASVRSLEPFSTACLMVMFGGESLNSIHYFLIMLAIVGVALSTYDPVNFEDQVKGTTGALIMVLLVANLCYSLRNVTLHYARDLIGFGEKITLFVASCAMAPIPALASFGLMFGMYRQWRPDQFTVRDPVLLGTSIVSFVLYNLASFLVLMRLDPTTHAMLLIGKRVVTVLLACAIMHQWPSWLQVVGLSITSIAVKFFESQKKAKDKDEVATGQKLNHTAKFRDLIMSQGALAVFASSLICVCTGVAMYSPS